MKRLISLILLLMPFVASAQDQSLEFFYIAHDRTTPVNDLCERLEEVYDNALNYEDYAVIFYMPNEDRPIIVKVNLEGDNRDDFRKIIRELRLESAHDIYVDTDLMEITELFNTYDFITETGEPRFSSVLLCWYVNPDFWLFQYNEALIANLYFTLEMDKYHRSGYMITEIWHAKDDGLEGNVDRRYPFGTKNLCSTISFKLFPY